jgi:ferredoxin
MHILFFRHIQRSFSLKLHFRDSKGQLIKTVEANDGDDILSIAHEHDIDLEGAVLSFLVHLSYQHEHLAGACEGSVACSTCHVILSPEHYDLLPEPGDDENDMLDMAFGLSDTSRLGCQVKLTRELDGMTATLPAATRNMFVDGAMSFCYHHVSVSPIAQGRNPPAISERRISMSPALQLGLLYLRRSIEMHQNTLHCCRTCALR